MSSTEELESPNLNDLNFYQSGSEWEGISGDEGSLEGGTPPPHQTSLTSTNITETNDTSTLVKCRWGCCGEVLRGLESLGWHVGERHAVAGPGGLFYCGWEGCSRAQRAFNARYKMLVHVRTHTNEKPHRCTTCHKSFTRAENLKIHARSHTGERPYVCPVRGCGKAYSNSSDRFKHTRTHSVEKPYKCKVAGCLKRYTDPSSLRKHLKTYNHLPSQVPQIETWKIETAEPAGTEGRTMRPPILDCRNGLFSGVGTVPTIGVSAKLQLVDESWRRTTFQQEGTWYLAGWPPHPDTLLQHHFALFQEEQDKPLDLSIAVRIQP